ncbi:MAG TPA: STAS domain-containing protein [Rhodocyclaceae bacterium]|nr:STAS domain-containing protein [Rhodocyclaceae bacterium]
MNIQLSHEGSVIVLKLQGKFDFESNPEFRSKSKEAIELNGSEIQVDLAGVNYLDSSALGMLLLLREKCEAAQKRVVLMNPSSLVANIFQVARFANLFDIRPST